MIGVWSLRGFITEVHWRPLRAISFSLHRFTVLLVRAPALLCSALGTHEMRDADTSLYYYVNMATDIPAEDMFILMHMDGPGIVTHRRSAGGAVCG